MSLVGRRIGQVKRVLCASPLFLARHGAITTPQNLIGADGLAPARELLHLTLGHPRLGEERVDRFPRLIASPLDALLPALLDGLGVAWMPEFAVYELVRNGSLVEIHSRMDPACGKYDDALSRPSGGVAPAVAVFMEFAATNYRKFLKVQTP